MYMKHTRFSLFECLVEPGRRIKNLVRQWEYIWIDLFFDW